jgi:hypothetical protein
MGTCHTEEMSITPVWDAVGFTTNYIAIKQEVTEPGGRIEAMHQALMKEHSLAFI